MVKRDATSTDEGQSAVSVRAVDKVFRSRSGQLRAAVDSIDLEIAQGEFVALLGPRGCGKTTLLRLVAGLDRAARGELALLGGTVSGPTLLPSVVFQGPASSTGATIRRCGNWWRRCSKTPDWSSRHRR